MDELYTFGMTVLMGFFAIMNPIGNAPIYIGLVEGYSDAEKGRVARKSVLFAFIIVSIFVIFGGIIFKMFGISIQAFQMAGGILLFLVGYQLLHGSESKMHHPHPDERLDGSDDVAISPLAVPILAGPGTISSALSFTATSSSPSHVAVVVVVFAFVCLLTYLAFIYSERIMVLLKLDLIKVVSRLMGLILTIIAVQMVIQGIKGAFY
jgi:multiple antibiotic resistance protein